MSTIPPPYTLLPSPTFLPFERGGLLFSLRQGVAFQRVAIDYTSHNEGWTLTRCPELKLGVCVPEGEEVEAMQALIHAAWCAGAGAKSRIAPYIDASPSTFTPPVTPFNEGGQLEIEVNMAGRWVRRKVVRSTSSHHWLSEMMAVRRHLEGVEWRNVPAVPSTPPTRETANTTVRRNDGFGEVEKWVLAIGIPLAIVAVSAIVGLLLLKH